MASSVFFHVGLPKTGTTYLQKILWANRESLAGAGLLLPGLERRDHLWASCVVREDPNVARRNPRAAGSWDRLVTDIARWSGAALITHEFFAAASAAQARAAIERLAPAEVHVVVTARDTLDIFTSSWQESLKNKSTTPLADYCRGVSDDPLDVWNWRTLDLSLVLERWSPTLPPGRVHVVTVRGGEDPAILWRRFAAVVGAHDVDVDLSPGVPNESMGIVEAETLRRINAALSGFDAPFDRGVWIRSYLADEKLVPRCGERFWPMPQQVDDCRERGLRAVRYVTQNGFDVTGDLEELLTPDHLSSRRLPDSVTDEEVSEVAVALVASLLPDVRELTNRNRRLLEELRGRADPNRPRAPARAAVTQTMARVLRAGSRPILQRSPRLQAVARSVEGRLHRRVER